MSFDRDTRNKLARMVGDARRRLVADITDSLRRLGLQDDGTLVPLSALPGLSDVDKAASEVLRDLLTHFAAQEVAASEANRAQAAHARLVREIGFTTLNRLVALRMAEERGLIIESVRNGLTAAGFQLFERIANGSLGTRAEAYRAYLESLYDELAVDLPSLFSRTNPESLVFPSEPVLEQVLGLLNDPLLADLWKEDETIGWVYQYYNDPDERKKMRDASQAPRNSRELAVRNQFFTPRYVVEFLTDNTLGRTWYEMRQGDTRLRDDCRYLVRRPTEVFLQAGESAPASPDDGADLSQEELLKQPVYVPFRAKKDPRDLKILDPACGSGHFLLYAFDLLETIYEEAWADESSPRSESTGLALREDYPDADELRHAVPALILRHNLHGVDIDPRAVQIAGLALWLRAQRSYQAVGLLGAARPRLTKGNLVVAEPMPGERDLLEQFVARLDPPLIGGLVKLVFTKMQLAGEAGTLLKIEDELGDAISSAKAVWQRGPRLQQLALMPYDVRQRPEQISLELDTSGVSDESFWEHVQERVFATLRDFAAQASNGDATRRRLFAEDTEHGFAFIDLCLERFAVVIMNPPFGTSSLVAKSFVEDAYPLSRIELYAAFVERSLYLLTSQGLIGAITSRTGFFLSSLEKWRERVPLHKAQPVVFADLGEGVLDDAVVEVAAYVLRVGGDQPGGGAILTAFRLLNERDKETALSKSVRALRAGQCTPSTYIPLIANLSSIPGKPLAYWLSHQARAVFRSFPPFENNVRGRTTRCGLGTLDDFRFLRLYWEVRSNINDNFVNYYHGGVFSPFYDEFNLCVLWKEHGRQVKSFVEQKVGSASRKVQGEDRYFQRGFVFPRRTKALAPKIMPDGGIFSTGGQAGFANSEDLLPSIALLSSRACSELIAVSQGRTGSAAQFEVGLIKRLPWPSLEQDSRRLGALALRGWGLKRSINTHIETSRAFTLPALLQAEEDQLIDRMSAWTRRVGDAEGELAVIQTEIDKRSLALYGLDRSLVADLPLTSDVFPGEASDSGHEASGHGAAGINDREAPSLVADLISWAVGVAFGRFDLRIAIGTRRLPEDPDPFAPLPMICPGMLTSGDGRLLDAAPDSYAVAIPEHGILVSDEGNSVDLATRVGTVLDQALGSDYSLPLRA